MLFASLLERHRLRFRDRAARRARSACVAFRRRFFEGSCRPRLGGLVRSGADTSFGIISGSPHRRHERAARLGRTGCAAGGGVFLGYLGVSALLKHRCGAPVSGHRRRSLLAPISSTFALTIKPVDDPLGFPRIFRRGRLHITGRRGDLALAAMLVAGVSSLLGLVWCFVGLSWAPVVGCKSFREIHLVWLDRSSVGRESGAVRRQSCCGSLSMTASPELLPLRLRCPALAKRCGPIPDADQGHILWSGGLQGLAPPGQGPKLAPMNGRSSPPPGSRVACIRAATVLRALLVFAAFAAALVLLSRSPSAPARRATPPAAQAAPSARQSNAWVGTLQDAPPSDRLLEQAARPHRSSTRARAAQAGRPPATPARRYLGAINSITRMSSPAAAGVVVYAPAPDRLWSRSRRPIPAPAPLARGSCLKLASSSRFALLAECVLRKALLSGSPRPFLPARRRACRGGVRLR